MTTQRQELFLKDMLTSPAASTTILNNNENNGASASSAITTTDNSSTPSIQLTKVLNPFQLYTKKRTDINNNSVEISLLGRTVEQYSLDVLSDRSVSVYLAEDGLSNGSTATAQNLIKKMLPITFSSVKKNDKIPVSSKSGNASSKNSNNLNSNQPPKVAFRVKSHGKGCNGTVKLFVMPFVITEEYSKAEEHYFLMIKAKRNSLGKGNNKYGIENAYMFQKSSDNDLIDQIIDRVQAFDSSSVVTTGSAPLAKNSSEITMMTTEITSIEQPSALVSTTNVKRVSAANTQEISKKKRVRSTSNVTQNDSKLKLRKTAESAPEEKQMFANNINKQVIQISQQSHQPSSSHVQHYQSQHQQHNHQQSMFQMASPTKTPVNSVTSTAPNNNTFGRTTRILSQGTVPLSHLDFNQSQRLPQTYTNISAVPAQNSQPSTSQLAMMVMMQNNHQQQQQQQQHYSNNNNNSNVNSNNVWNSSTYQSNNNRNTPSISSNPMSITNMGAAMKNHLVELDYQKQFRQSFNPPPQQQQQQTQQSFQPIQYYQAPMSYGDNRAIKRTIDDIFSEEFNSNVHQPHSHNIYHNNQQDFSMNHHNQFSHLTNDDDIMSVQHQEIVEIIDSIQMFDMPLPTDDEEPLNFFC